MVPKADISSILKGYDPDNITIATVCSHSSLQILAGAKKEGFKTMGIAIGKQPRFYDAFPKSKPDSYMVLEDYKNLMDKTDELVSQNAVIIPHGSFVEYLGTENYASLKVPTYGNRAVLEWESDRNIERQWLEGAGLKMPELIENPKDIDRPVLVKYHGAKGGRGFFIAKDYRDFKMGIDWNQKYTIQEYVLGTRYYIHYFYSPIKDDGYRLSRGSLELMGFDRRDETNIDEMYKLGAQEDLKKHGLYPSFVVTGNIPLVLRESLLPKAFEMGEAAVEKSIELFGGMIGPFCLETIVTDKLEFYVFEISARIVAGTNLFVSGSPYSDLVEKDMSTGRRIAREIKNAASLGRMGEIIT
jgi:5-formaminoimidazole-4-carboxamide-1-(beta)-D-ribofuranosyl 5'-monophosphate synthetase